MKDQQTNNIDSQEVMNNNSQEQDTVQTENSNVSQADSPEVAATELQPLSTEKFQTLLAANTAKQSKLRLDYAKKLSELQEEYDDSMGDLLSQEHQANRDIHEAREAYEMAKEDYEIKLRSIRRSRNEAECNRNTGKAEAKNYWTTENEKIQSERHNIFERYRDSGGVLQKEAEGLLHPGWTRDKKGGMSDEEK